jgi:hypothetical protein
MSSCDICVENYNRSTRIEVKCPYCEYTACRSCCETWILDNNIARCLNNNCAKEWGRKFLVENFTKKFMATKYKKHREKVLFDEQRALLPATQPIVERMIEGERITKKIEEINKQIRALYLETHKLNRERHEMFNNNRNERRLFIKACPDNGCRGFLSTQWKCGICEKWTCNKCHVIIGIDKEAEHNCNETDIATAKFINNDTKSCPTCGTGIHKIEGCFADNTPILMASGTLKRADSIKTGDYLMGENGIPKKVLNTFQGDDMMYKVKQSNGLSYVVNSKHKLALKCKNMTTINWYDELKSWKINWFNKEQMRMKQLNFSINDYNNDMNNTYIAATNFISQLDLTEPITLTVEEYIKLDAWSKNNLVGYKVNELKFIEQPVFLDPYLLGLWLGDGDSNCPLFRTSSYAIYKYIRNWSIVNKASLEKRGDQEYIIHSNGTNPFMNMMTLYNLKDNKHIPYQYLFNKREIRMRLLAGLIDTIGCITNKNKIMLIFESNALLLQNICALVRSLGYTLTINDMVKLHKKQDSSETSGYKQHCLINIDYKFIDELPTIDTLTSEHRSEEIIDYTSRIEVSEVGRNKYYGWTLEDGPLFLLSDYTVVHNCDQMFCTMCHTAFSWRTGRIETHIHNPHYYELMRRTGGNIQRNHNEVICGREINHIFTRELTQEMNAIRLPSEQIKYITNVCRNIIHNRYTVLPRFEVHALMNHQDLRVAYLRKYIDETEFKLRLQRMDKRTNQHRETYDILTVIQNAVTDILYRYHNKMVNTNTRYDRLTEEEKSFILLIPDEIKNIINYANECLKDVSTTYGTRERTLDNELNFI